MYLWEETRRNIYDSPLPGPERTSLVSQCICHSPKWKENFKSLVDKLTGTILPEESPDGPMEKVVCSCNRVRSPGARQVHGTNLPSEVYFDRVNAMRHYFNNMLNIGQYPPLEDARKELNQIIEICGFTCYQQHYRFLFLLKGYLEKPYRSAIDIEMDLDNMYQFLVKESTNIESAAKKYGCTVNVQIDPALLAHRILRLHVESADRSVFQKMNDFIVKLTATTKDEGQPVSDESSKSPQESKTDEKSKPTDSVEHKVIEVPTSNPKTIADDCNQARAFKVDAGFQQSVTCT